VSITRHPGNRRAAGFAVCALLLLILLALLAPYVAPHGVDVIDHGDEVDAECIELMVKAGTFWVPSQIYLQCLIDIGFADAAGVSPAAAAKRRQAVDRIGHPAHRRISTLQRRTNAAARG